MDRIQWTACVGLRTVLDFSEKNYFQGTHTIKPMAKTRSNWQRIFSTALDDMVGLIAPRRIVYCEGKQEPSADGDEQGLDAIVYNEIFAISHPDTLFISSGGTNDLPKNSSLAIKVMSKAFLDVDLLLLRDRDDNLDTQRNDFLVQASHHRMLLRREIENYLLDSNVLRNYCTGNGKLFDETEYARIVSDIATQDLKQGNSIRQLRELCGCFDKPNEEFKKELASYIEPSTTVYAELETCIFG
jgi:hypothetical protein